MQIIGGRVRFPISTIPSLVTKKSLVYFLTRPYRKPTQVGGCKYIKVNERTFAKELGKTVAVTSG